MSEGHFREIKVVVVMYDKALIDDVRERLHHYREKLPRVPIILGVLEQKSPEGEGMQFVFDSEL